MDLFSQRLSNYVAMVENALEDKATGTLPAARLAAIEKSQNEFSSGFLGLLTAESRLLALGHPDVQKQLRNFGESAQELYKKVHVNNGALTLQQIQDEMATLRQQRYDLILSIGKAETDWWDDVSTSRNLHNCQK
jgi:hypothetical protein